MFQDFFYDHNQLDFSDSSPPAEMRRDLEERWDLDPEFESCDDLDCEVLVGLI